MSNYTKTTNFAAKDSLPSGNAGKIVKGTEIDAEFNNIATASATKANINDATLTGTTTFGSLNDGTITIAGWVDEDNMSSNSAVLIPTQQSVKAYVDTNVTAQDLDVTDGSASIDIDLDSESLGILGGTGVTSTASGTGVTLAIDSTVATLTGSQTLTNKTLTTPTILTSFTIGSATISEAELEILDGAIVTTAELNVLDGITSTTAELNILDGVTSNAAEINILDGVTSTTAELNILDGVTATAAEINILTGYTGTTADLNTLDGVTASAAELNILDGATVTTAEVNILDGVTSTAAELNILDGVTSTAAELNILDGVTSTTAELNILDGVTSTAAELNVLDGVTSTTAELNILDGVTSTATELNLLDGVTSTTAELNYTDGVTSAIQTQLDGKISGTDAALTGNATITTSDNTTQLALISTDADANAGPILDLFRNSASAADNDLAGQVYFSGNNDADEKTYYGQITSQITDVSNGSEDFALELSTLTAGASNSRLFISPTETVFNESSADLDFRIESDGNTNAFFLEGSSGNVAIGVSNPSDYYVKDLVVSGSSEGGITIASSATTYNNYLAFADSNVGDARFAGLISYMHSIDAMGFRTASVERMRISSGGVGIGVTSIQASAAGKTLETSGCLISGGTLSAHQTNRAVIEYNVGSNSMNLRAYGASSGTGVMIFSTGGGGGSADSQRMRIDESGSVGISNSIASSFNGGANNLVVGSGSGAEGMTIYGGAESNIFFADGTAGTAAYIGRIEYSHSSNMMKFYVNNVNAMNIDASGNLLVGTDNSIQYAGIGTKIQEWGSVQVVNDSSTGGGDAFSYFSSAGNNYRFWVNANGQVASIYTSIHSLSDQRFKENIRDLDDGLSKVMQLQPRKFDWKEGKGKNITNDRGFIAQEFEEVFPDLIGDWKEEAPEGEEPYKSLSQDLIPTLVKAIQEQQATIEALTQRIETLENT